MVNRNQGKAQETELKTLVGECLHSWSLVELQLSHTFVAHLKSMEPLGYIVWDSVISFEAKLKCLNEMLKHTLQNQDAELKLIWNKLNERIRSSQSLRNQLAHAGYIGNSHVTSLVPYLSMADVITNPKSLKRLNANNLNDRNKQFLDIQSAIQWFTTCSISAPDTKDVLREPELIKEIRAIISSADKVKTK